MHNYHQTQISVPGDSEFRPSHARKFSTTFGKLVPVNLIECYPGETHRINTEQLVRLQPMLAPVMHEAALDINHFFVPFRILWDGWQKFITGDSAADHPYIVGLNLFQNGQLSDYLGYTAGGNATASLEISAFPVAAYLQIFDEWYRDQNLVEPQFPVGGLTPGDNSGELNGYLAGSPLAGSLQHDYFTSCLPFPQKGPDVKIPVFTNGDGIVTFNNTGESSRVINAGTGLPASDAVLSTEEGDLQAVGQDINIDPNGSLILTESQIGTIRALRLASVLQEWYEKQAVAGSRYNETILAHFATHTGDARLDRPEHLGGYTQKIRFSEVLSTAQTETGEDTIPVGYMAGHGISYGDSRTFTYKPKEHGYIMSILRVRPKTSYSQGINKIMLRRTLHDYMWPTFANVGDQEVTKKELWLGKEIDGTDTGATREEIDETFGYQERYAELKTGFDTVHGDFKDTLRFWEMSRGFDDLPALNFEFIRADQSDFDRIFAVQGQDAPHTILVQMHLNIQSRRALPVYSDPTL